LSFPQRIRDGALEWLICEYEGKEKIKVTNSGNGNFDEFKASLSDDRISFGFFRMISGDQESKRVKFVFYLFVGSSANVMAKSRVSVHKPDIVKAIGQFHVEIFADGLSDVNEQEVRTKIKKSGGADYDQGSNAGGSAYTTSAGDIKAQAKGTFLSKEKETNIGPVIFEKSALPQTTPIDLKGRPMVAPPTEAMRNVNHTGNLDVDKFKGKVSVLPSGSGGDVAPAAPAPASAPASAPAPVSVEDPVKSAIEAASALTLAQAKGEAAPAEE
jgi:hypothetical protein